MVLIVVKENQTVRGVKMSNELWNIVKIVLVVFILAFAWNEAVGKTETSIVGGAVGKLGSDYSTMQVDVYVNGLYHPFPIVSVRECPHVVKIIMKDDTGETKSEDELEADCE